MLYHGPSKLGAGRDYESGHRVGGPALEASLNISNGCRAPQRQAKLEVSFDTNTVLSISDEIAVVLHDITTIYQANHSFPCVAGCQLECGSFIHFVKCLTKHPLTPRALNNAAALLLQPSTSTVQSKPRT